MRALCGPRLGLCRAALAAVEPYRLVGHNKQGTERAAARGRRDGRGSRLGQLTREPAARPRWPRYASSGPDDSAARIMFREPGSAGP